MAPREERAHSENESNRYQSIDYHPQEHRKPRVKVRARQFRHQSPHLEGSSFGRDTGRSHSSLVDNKTYRKSFVARKSARNGSQNTTYRHGCPRDPIKPKSMEKPYHISSLGKTSSGGGSLSRHNMHQTDVRNNGMEADKYLKNHQINDKTQRKRADYHSIGKNSGVANSMDGQTPGRPGNQNPRILALETHTREPASGSFDRRPRSGPPMAVDGSDQNQRNDSIVKTEPPPSRLNRTSGTSAEYPSRSSQGCNATENQNRTLLTPIQPILPESDYLRRRQSPPRLRLASGPHSDSNDPSIGSAAHGKPLNEIDIVTPISTSAMSISSGSTPSQPSSSNRKNPHHRRFSYCIKCKKPGTPMVDILICCTECRIYYHTSCHEPKPSLNRQGRVDGVETWKCQRCIIRSRQPSDISTSVGKSSNSTLSEISSASSENSTTQISRGIVQLSLHARNSELNSNLPSHGINAHQDVHFDSDFGHRRKRFRRNISAPGHQSGASRSTAYFGVSGKIPEEFGYEESPGSPNIFPGDRKIAVVIGNRSWDISTSTNDRKSNQNTGNLIETHTTPEDFQETAGWISKVQHPASVHRTPPPVLDQDEKATIIGPDDKTQSPPKRLRYGLPLEIKDSQEIEEELTDAPMSLDSPDVYSPIQEEYNMCNRINRDSMGSSVCENPEVHWRLLEENRSYMNHGRSSYGRPEISPGKNSPQYPPSVGDCGKYGNEEPTSRENRDMSSPPYSPPPAPEPVDPPCVPLPKTTLQEERLVNDDGFYCKGCTFYVANNGQYKDKLLCGSCVIKTPARRNTHTTPDSSQKLPQETIKSTQSSVSNIKQLSWNHQYRHLSTSKSAPLSTPDQPELPTGNNSGEASKGLSPRGVPKVDVVPLVKKFQTSKDRVIERYNMKSIGLLEQVGKPKTRTPITQNKRKREEPVLGPHIDISDTPDKKGKSRTVAANEEPWKPVKPSNLTGPARKFPSKPTPPDIMSPPRSSINTNVDRSMTRDGSVSSKRRGPAIKSAGRPIQVPISDSDDSEKDNGDPLKELERKLQEQKGYTRKQVGKAIKLENKLKEVEREKREIQEKLDIALAANQKISNPTSPKRIRKVKKLKRLIQLDRNDETETCNHPVQPTNETCAIEARKEPTLKELYKDYSFTSSVPWFCPPELPMPDPSTFRKPGWRKPQERAPGYDNERRMKVHLHRQLTRDNRQPLRITAEPFFDFSSPHFGNSRSASLDDEFGDDLYWPLGGHETTVDEFMGFPDNMVPAVKDGILGFRPGIINQRTRRLDRNVQHYRIRAPGVLTDRI